MSMFPHKIAGCYAKVGINKNGNQFYKYWNLFIIVYAINYNVNNPCACKKLNIYFGYLFKFIKINNVRNCNICAKAKKF